MPADQQKREVGWTQHTLPDGQWTECTMCGDVITQGVCSVKALELDDPPMACIACYEDVRASETSAELHERFALRGKVLRER